MLLSIASITGSVSATDWFAQPAVSHLLLAADGVQAVWLDLRDDAIRLRKGATEDLSHGQELARLTGQVGLGLYRVGSDLLVHSAAAGGSERLTLFDGDDGTTLAAFNLKPTASFSIIGPQRASGSMLIAHDARQIGAPDIFRLRPGSAALQLLEQNPGRIFSWMADAEGQLLLARRWRPAGHGIAYQLLYRQRVGGPWRQIAEHDLNQAPTVPHGFTADGSSVYVTTENAAGDSELRLLRVLSGRLGPVILKIPDTGIESLLHDPTNGALALVGYEQSLPGVEVMSEPWQATIRLLNRQLPDARYQYLGQRGASDSLWHVYGAGRPGGYYLLDEKELSLAQLAAVYPNLAGRQLAPTQPFQFEAEDGLQLSGYLTIPDRNSPPSAVLLVHGGPWARDHWKFDPEVQFLASQGYAVIQVNFRGSRGLGNALLQAGRRQWGRAMQTDLVAAITELAGRGLINAGRVCIMGSSYGGYAALMGVIEFPEVFRCAVARSAVVDLYEQIRTLQRSGNQRAYLEWSVMVGNLGGSRAKLDGISPLHRLQELKRPLLLAHGLLDPVVNIDLSRQLAEKLIENQADIRWLPIKEDGHGLSNNHNRSLYYSAVAEFLARSLAGRQ